MLTSWKSGEFKRGIKVWGAFHSWLLRATQRIQKMFSIIPCLTAFLHVLNFSPGFVAIIYSYTLIYRELNEDS